VWEFRSRLPPFAGGAIGLMTQVGALGLAVATALLLSAAQWVPTVALVRHSARVAIPAWVNTYWSVHPAWLADLVVPRVVEGFPMSGTVRGVVFEAREPLLVSIYLGLPCAALVVLAFAAGGRGRRFVLAFVFFLLAALGRYTLLYALLLHVPGVAFFRYPVKYLFPAALFWALAAAHGMEAWLAEWGPVETRRAMRVAALVLALAAGLLLLGEETRRRPQAFTPWMVSGGALAGTTATLWTAGGVGLAAALLLAARARAALRPGITLAFAVLAAVDLAAAGSGVNPLAPSELMRHQPPLLQQLPAEARLFVFPYPILWLNQQMSRGPAGWLAEWRWALGSIERLQPPSGARWRVYGSYDGDFTGLATPVTSTLGSWVERGGLLALRLLQMGGVDHVVALVPPPIPGLVEVGSWPSVYREPIRLFAVDGALPRAYAVSGVRVAVEPAAFDVMADPGFDPRREVILPAGAPHPAARDFTSAVRVAWRRADAVGLEAELSGPGHLVLLDGHERGWRAEVDGEPAELLRANVVFRAVAVPAGRHRVTFRYRPSSVLAGALVSALALALLLLVVLRRLITPERGYSIQAFPMSTAAPAEPPRPNPTTRA
jgi:hypothetical protein